MENLNRGKARKRRRQETKSDEGDAHHADPSAREGTKGEDGKRASTGDEAPNPSSSNEVPGVAAGHSQLSGHGKETHVCW